MPPGPDPNNPYLYQPPNDPGGYGAPQPNLGPGYGPGYDPNAPVGPQSYEQQPYGQPYEQPYDSTYQLGGPPPVDPTTGMPMSGMPMSGGPMPTAPMGMPPPPPPRKSNTGLIVGLSVGGGVVVLVVIALIVVFGVVLAGGNHHKNDVLPSPSDYTPSLSDSPTPSPSPSTRDLTTLDSASTDQTPFTEQQIFPTDTVTASDGTSYTLESAGAFSACTDSGNSSTEGLMKAHGCGNMMVGVYANNTVAVEISTMVLALPDASSASAIQSTLNNKGDEWNGLAYYCPKDASYYQTLCGGTNRRWWGAASVFHRYVIISMLLLQSGADPTGTTAQNAAIDATTNGVEQAIPAID